MQSAKTLADLEAVPTDSYSEHLRPERFGIYRTPMGTLSVAHSGTCWGRDDREERPDVPSRELQDYAWALVEAHCAARREAEAGR